MIEYWKNRSETEKCDESHWQLVRLLFASGEKKNSAIIK